VKITLFSPHSSHWTETKLLRGFGIIIVLLDIELTVLWLYFELSDPNASLHRLSVTGLASILEGNLLCRLGSSFKFRKLLSSIPSLVLCVSTCTLGTCPVLALFIDRG
jgi:hypothetical protein